MLQQFAAVDQNFYRAISALAGQQITGFADLHTHVAHYASSLFAGISNDVTNKVQGHVAEQIVAHHLRQLGHHVTVAAHSNQAGYDLIIDHHLLINVKDHISMAGINAHFAHHPNIPVIVPDHFASTQHGILHIDASLGVDQLHHALDRSHVVISDHGLNHHSVVRHTHRALNAATGHVPMHLPWITIATSTWREAKLFIDGATDLEEAIKRIICDTAGAGIGGAIGAKAGAAIGTAIFPGVGTLVGLLAGSIIGYKGGRSVSDEVKYAPLREAQLAHTQALEKLKAKIDKTQKRADAEYEVEKKKAWEELQVLKQIAQQKIAQLERDCVETTQALSTLTPAQKSEVILAVDVAFQTEENLALELIERAQQIPVWKRVLLVKKNMLHARTLLKMIKMRKRNFHRSLDAIERSTLDDAGKTAAIFELTLALGYAEIECRDFLKQLKEQSDKYRAIAFVKSEEICSEVLEVRLEKTAWLEEVSARLVASSEKEVKPHIEAFKPIDDKLKLAMKSFGLPA